MKAFPVGFCDLHSHVLPALDDGARALAESVALTEVLGRMGFDLVHATPHQKVDFFVPERAAIDRAHAEVSTAIAGLGVELRLGAENFWDELFLQRARTGAQPTYTGGRAFLFELDVRQSPPNLDEQLFRMRVDGLLPVMAHPERYMPFWDKPDRYQALARTSALLVDLGALDGAHGRRQGQLARQLVEEGLAHACASDVHSVADARSAGAGIAWIKKRLGDAAVQRLLDENPRRILQGELPD